MSSYCHFTINVGELRLPIGSYSRSSVIYQIFSEILPYGEPIPLTEKDLNLALENIKDAAQRWQGFIKERCEMVETIRTMAGSFEKRLDHIRELKMDIHELNENLEETQRAINFVEFLDGIITEAKWSSKFDENHYLFAEID